MGLLNLYGDGKALRSSNIWGNCGEMVRGNYEEKCCKKINNTILCGLQQ